ncbi:unnamed protein product [Cuscuta campestris]|uniref:Uncharacterized protein n=2 Tax=Cuscuta sect. Cleistogrammica TaxID=1824901 RepID=A0A484K7G4_9ASTE|nr:hypothetical protein DM860_009052 [Cuscuta australis]VFQ60505.1 unnamed protein product [Cuscuta campestris]
MFEHITASEVAGYAVGALLLCATVSAYKVDSFVASSQRSSLGMCKRCGDLKLIACRQCKGGARRSPAASFPLPPSPSSSSSCTKCQARGYFRCPDCST